MGDPQGFAMRPYDVDHVQVGHGAKQDPCTIGFRKWSLIVFGGLEDKIVLNSPRRLMQLNHPQADVTGAISDDNAAV
jgi:hypothetical protein